MTNSAVTARQVYDDLMKESFGPALRRAGLKGSAGRFELPSTGFWALLGFQKSAYSAASSVRFTVNLSAIDREAWAERQALRPGLSGRPKPSTFYGDWADQTRIGTLTDSRDDLWWRLRRGEDPQPVATQVLFTLLNVAVPWLVAKAR